MDKNKRIYEMAEAIFLNCICGIWFDDAEKIADFVINKQGYRKASEVAREIFAEIKNILDRHSISYLKVGQICGEHYYDGVMQFDIDELEKKYTEGEG